MEIGKILNGGAEGVWHKVPGTNVEVQIRQPKPARTKELRRQATRRRYTPKGFEEIVDEAQFEGLLLDEAVLDWRNVTLGGQPYPCTPENRRALNDNWGPFSRLWNAVVLQGEQQVEEAREADLGN